MPPRHGKSRITSVEFPTWVLGRNPKAQIVLASYSQDLPKKHSRAARERMMEPLYRSIFKTRLNSKDQSVEEWSTTAGGGLKTVGVGGSLTGHGADYLVIDDPFKDHEEAHSPTMRSKVWEWFLSVAYTRLSPNGRIIVTMTRWHMDDIVGRLEDPNRVQELEDAGIKGERFEKLNLTSIAKDKDPLGRQVGEALFPERWPVERVRASKAVLGTYLSAAMHDGNPIPKGGNYVDSEQFIIINRDQLPSVLRWFRFWDMATTEKARSDYTASLKGAIDDNGNFYLADGIFGKWEWPEARRRISEVARREKLIIGIESTGGFVATYQDLNELLKGEVTVWPVTVSSDKLLRALSWIPKVEGRKVFLVAGEWVQEFKSQVQAFPSGTHDDFVDALSGLHQMITHKPGMPEAMSQPDKYMTVNRARRERRIAG